jgi:hypothetical protein
LKICEYSRGKHAAKFKHAAIVAVTARQMKKTFAASLPRRSKLAANCRGKLQFLL